MHLKKYLEAWPESAEELLALLQSFDRLQKQHAKEYSVKLSIVGIATPQVEIDAVLKANDKLGAAGELLYQKLDSWS